MRLEGNTALVPGSGQGIDRGIAVRFAREGAAVIVDDRLGDDSAHETVKLVQAEGQCGCVIAGDIGRVGNDRRVIDAAIEALGDIDILVNDAVVERRSDFRDVGEADYDLVLDVNLKDTFFVTQAFVRHRRDRNSGGRIINISSVHEQLPFPHFASYCARKGGLKMMMRTLAIELAPLSITVNNIAPGAVETPINARLLQTPELLDQRLGEIPLQRLGTPDDVAGAAAYLASDDVACATDTTLFVDGGLLWNYREP